MGADTDTGNELVGSGGTVSAPAPIDVRPRVPAARRVSPHIEIPTDNSRFRHMKFQLL
jgi:hypothetical protein